MNNTITEVAFEIDKPNARNRVFTRKAAENAIDKYRPSIENRRAMGELFVLRNENDSIDCGNMVNLANVSHIITKLDINASGQVTVVAEILETPSGKMFQKLMQTNKHKFSYRLIGSLVDEKIDEAEFIAIDLIIYPQQKPCDCSSIIKNEENND